MHAYKMSHQQQLGYLDLAIDYERMFGAEKIRYGANCVIDCINRTAQVRVLIQLSEDLVDPSMRYAHNSVIYLAERNRILYSLENEETFVRQVLYTRRYFCELRDDTTLSSSLRNNNNEDMLDFYVGRDMDALFARLCHLTMFLRARMAVVRASPLSLYDHVMKYCVDYITDDCMSSRNTLHTNVLTHGHRALSRELARQVSLNVVYMSNVFRDNNDALTQRAGRNTTIKSIDYYMQTSNIHRGVGISEEAYSQSIKLIHLSCPTFSYFSFRARFARTPRLLTFFREFVACVSRANLGYVYDLRDVVYSS